jgi:hypothetical protein
LRADARQFAPGNSGSIELHGSARLTTISQRYCE